MAKIYKDILLDEDGDLLVQNGDFVIGDSLVQEKVLILQSLPGYWRNAPLLGPYLIKQMRGDFSNLTIDRSIDIHMRLDGIEDVAIVRDINGEITDIQGQRL